MNKFLLLIILCFPITCMAQSEWQRPLTPAERLEKAKREEAAAKKAIKDAKRAEKAARRQAKKAKKETTQPETLPTDTTTYVAPIPSVARKTTPIAPENINTKDAPYIGDGIVPEIEGKVIFTLNEDVREKSSSSIYSAVYSFLDSLSTAKEQIESSIVLYNENEHVVVAKFNEWLTFSNNAFSLDRTRFMYTIIARCTENHLTVTMERISYAYEENRGDGLHVKAEDWITDKYAVNKKGTRLQTASGKFRRCTIDRKNEIFAQLKKAINLSH